MNDNTIETIMRSYAHSAVSDKKQDLQKFHLTQTQPHHSSAPMKRRLAWIGLCVFVVSLFCVSLYLSQQTPEPLWDLDAQEFASFHAGKYHIPADQTQTLAECIAKSEETAHAMASARLPNIQCSDITAYWVYRRYDDSGSVGISGTLTPASGNIRQAAVSYYFNHIPENREIITEHGYAGLPQTAAWQGLSVSYSDPQATEDGTMYKVFFEDNKFFCCLDIYTPEGMEITDLLTELFH